LRYSNPFAYQKPAPQALISISIKYLQETFYRETRRNFFSPCNTESSQGRVSSQLTRVAEGKEEQIGKLFCP
jgi:hypothetical protein